MTAEELSELATVQRTLDRLADKLDAQVAATALGFQEVKIDIAGMKARFLGGWFVICALGAIGVFLVGLLTQLHLHVQF